MESGRESHQQTVAQRVAEAWATCGAVLLYGQQIVVREWPVLSMKALHKPADGQ